MAWIVACDAADLDAEDAIRVDHAGRSYAICLTDDGRVCCIDGVCPQDGAHLAGGLVEGTLIECPDGGCLYDIRDGAAKGRAGRAALGSYPARIAAGWIELDLPG